MAITLTYTDLRTNPSILLKFSTHWKQDMTSFEVVTICMGTEKADELENDLYNDNAEIIVSWFHKPTGEICEIGGVGTLKWKIADDTFLSIAYRNSSSTDEQEDELIEWSQSQDDLN